VSLSAWNLIGPAADIARPADARIVGAAGAGTHREPVQDGRDPPLRCGYWLFSGNTAFTVDLGR